MLDVADDSHRNRYKAAHPRTAKFSRICVAGKFHTCWI